MILTQKRLLIVVVVTSINVVIVGTISFLVTSLWKYFYNQIPPLIIMYGYASKQYAVTSFGSLHISSVYNMWKLNHDLHEP